MNVDKNFHSFCSHCLGVAQDTRFRLRTDTWTVTGMDRLTKSNICTSPSKKVGHKMLFKILNKG